MDDGEKAVHIGNEVVPTATVSLALNNEPVSSASAAAAVFVTTEVVGLSQNKFLIRSSSSPLKCRETEN